MLTRAVPSLSNSIVASRDTNVSPKEIYDFLQREDDLKPATIMGSSSATQGRALDLGAGAGVSTQVLLQAGWNSIDAVDVSRLAWDKFATARGDLPSSVRFFHTNDEQFVELWRREVDERTREPQRYDLVVLNYAVNTEKARRLAAELLVPGRGRLLAPTNVQNDYWFEQTYVLLNKEGSIQWTRSTLGSYDVLFQPDFTSPSCQGQWCPALRADKSSLAI
jgi:SAM-dependent methyltransferase